jgi:16S rRNA A1518/A1519 N6-dimethyltransferase RsmA/KsgA/DIM1 with predicted DNA glycosylase/AP lyase activity
LDPVVTERIQSPQVVQFGQENTPWPIIEQMIRLMNLTPEDTVADLGCGDGRVLIAASTMTGCRGIGVEIDKEKCEQAIRNIREAGLSAKITIINGDVLEFEPSLHKTTAITAYLYPDLLEKISGKFYSVRVAATPYHRVPNLKMEQHGDVWVFRSDSHPVK